MVEVVLEPYEQYPRREKSFKAVLQEVTCETYIRDEETGDQGIRARLIFADDPNIPLTFFGLGKVEETRINAFTTDIGKVVKDLKGFGVEAIYDSEAPNLRFNPDLVGKEIDWELKTRKYTTGESAEERTAYEWRVVGVGGLGEAKPTPTPTPAPAKAKAPAKPAAKPAQKPGFDPVAKLKDLLVEMPLPLNNTGIMEHIKKVLPEGKERSAVQGIRNKALNDFVREGFLAIDEDAKYSLA